VPPPPHHGRPPAPPPYRPGQPRPPQYRPIHRPPYVYPHGYAYRRWRVGLTLPLLFLGGSYIFHDYATLYLGPPPPGYYWVRYGPDLLLVRASNGYIADVIYGAFY
jgi:Ni/Co efflux regulator RcnB